MANNNVQNVKFLRNGSVFTPSLNPVKTAREVALDAMNGQLDNLVDGTAILGRYQETNGIVKTLVGFAYISDNAKTLTVFDVDGAGADVDAKIKAAIDALDSDATSVDGKNVQVKVTETDGKITAVNITTDNTVNSGDVANAIEDAISELDGSVVAETGFYVKSVTEADGKISGTTEVLPSLAEVKETGKPIVAVSEDKGQVAASVGTINAGFVNIADSGSLISATTVEGALAEIAAEINAMDKSASAEDGKVVTTVSEADGVVSETKANVKDLQLGGYVKDTTATGNIASSDTINAALSKLENKAAAITIANADGSINVTTVASGTDINVNIKSGEHILAKDGNAGIYTNISLSSITPSSTTVKEEYQLTATDGTKLGDTIKIYKDSSIVEIYLGTSGDSVDATTGVITKLDGDKQYLNYVYLDANGNYQITKVNISVFITEQEFASGVTFDSTENKVKGVVDPTSESFLTVGTDGFKLSGVQDAIGTAISGLDVSDSAVAGQYVSQVSETDGKIAVVRANVSEAVLNNYSKGSDSGSVASTDTINQAISKLENQIDSKVDALDATVSGETADGKVNVKVTETNGVITAVDVVGTDIASASALTAEIAARKAVDGQNGDTYAANTSSPYISGATSLNDADVKLASALKSLSDATVNEVQVNGHALAETGNAVNIQISAAAGTGAASTPITVYTDNSTGAITLKLEGLDCGTY